MGTKTLTKLLMASLMLMLSVSVAVAGTFALFSDKTNVTNHLSAGTLKIGLERVELVKNVPDPTTGMPTETVDNETKDFTAADSSNVFGVGANEHIAPGSSYQAEMHVVNAGDIAFTYSVAIKLDLSTDDENAELAKQLIVYVDGAAEGVRLSDCKREDGLGVVSEKLVQKNTTDSYFTVKIVFAPSAGNAAQEKEVNFDLIVNAEQYVADARQE